MFNFQHFRLDTSFLSICHQRGKRSELFSFSSKWFYVRRVYTFHKLSGPTAKLRLLNDCKYMKSYMRTAVLEMNLEAIFELLNTT